MDLEKSLVISNPSLATLVKFAALLMVAIFAPLINNQLLTGSLVNAALFIAVGTLDLTSAVLLSFLPSIYALFSGTLPANLAPMLPFIMLSNILMVTIFASLEKYNFWIRIFVSALAKSLFLYGAVCLIVNCLFQDKMASAMTVMFSWPQLLTALIGGSIAFLVVKSIKK
jgi:hypothetical protein